MSPDHGARNPDSVSFLNLWPGLFLTRSAQVYPSKTAIHYNDVSYSYSEFDERVQNLAGALVNAGISAGDRVAYLVPNIPQLLEGHYGPMRMGAVLVAINTRLSSREIVFILRHSGAKALVFDSEYADSIKDALEHPETLGVTTADSSEINLLVEVIDTDSKTNTPPTSGLRGAIEYEKFLSSGVIFLPARKEKGDVENDHARVHCASASLKPKIIFFCLEKNTSWSSGLTTRSSSGSSYPS